MGDFEWALVHALNSFFEKDGIAAIAYRLKQSRFSGQFTDILVDSRIPEYYLAIECKSLDARKTGRSTSSSTSASLPEDTRCRARRNFAPAREGRASWQWSFAAAPARRERRTLSPGGRSSRATRWSGGPLPARYRAQPPCGEKGRLLSDLPAGHRAHLRILRPGRR